MFEFHEMPVDLTAAASDGRSSAAEWFWTEIALKRDQWSLLRHPFYERWSAGDLDEGEISTYASEYDHAVVAIASAAHRAASQAAGLLADALEAHAADKEQHVAMWRAFAQGAGWYGGAAWYFGEDPLPGTVACARAWSGGADRDLAHHLVTLYAIESALPAINRTKLDGLVEHYGFTDGPATTYLRLHSTVQEHDPELLRAALEGLLPQGDPFALLRQTEIAYRSYWEMLDGLQTLRGH